MHENRETSKTPAVQTDCRSAGAGLGRTARMYVSEESHCGTVPMNHSNKDGVSSAESEEGRLRIKENTSHSTRTRHRAGVRVSRSAKKHILSIGVGPLSFSGQHRHHLHNRQTPEPCCYAGRNAPRETRP
jgi:hypothetical protein